jgi:hypothetical protein
MLQFLGANFIGLLISHFLCEPDLPTAHANEFRSMQLQYIHLQGQVKRSQVF